MSLLTRKIAAFAKKVANLSPKPGGTMPVAELQAQFDAAPEELRAAFNGAMDDLTSVTPGSSGAENIGSAPIAGLNGDTPYEQLTDLFSQVLTKNNSAPFTPTSDNQPATKKYVDATTAGVVLGQVPDGTITTAKLADDVRIKRMYKVVW